MEISVLIGGKAGQGIAKATFIIGKIFTNLGFFVFNYRNYSSLIKGGHNYNSIRISDTPVFSHEEIYDIIIALDENTIKKHLKKLKPDGIVITTKEISEKYGNFIGVDARKIIEKEGLPEISLNTILIGAFFSLFGVSWEEVEKVIKNELKKDVAVLAAKKGYDSIQKIREIGKIKKEKRIFISGSEAIALGAVYSGLDIYIAYPMTPSTPVLHFLAKNQKRFRIKTFQLENEIAVVNAALGASYAGAKVMVGTSGGGFALMTEALSLQGITEIPLVVYLAQRTAPSTGVPTYTEQGDLKFALNAGHGEFPRVVIAPGDAKEAFYRTIEAFYLAYKYRVLSIILGDKHLAESNYTFDFFENPKVEAERFILVGKEIPEDFKSYLITESGVSPRTVPGEKAVIRANSYEHDENGITTEDAEIIARMKEKRLRKVEVLKREVDMFEPAIVYGSGENLIISWGSTKGAIIDSLKFLKNYRFLQIIYAEPFPTEIVKKEIENSGRIVIVENNATGLMAKVLRENTGIEIKEKILKYDGRPFTSSEIIRRLKM
ncbi:MAG: 2-oxoacid:acceptor oxidoreductase subunit alpha [Candidatus Aenigmarchaeota archaeon]|nr:2-oxoacid:acceptor oxidoreductase subunit alpha [Candidatus Aenigmarchaeota archaeon]